MRPWSEGNTTHEAAATCASWRFRRLHRWQAELFEDESLTEDERLDNLDKVLSREAPKLFEQCSREVAMSLVQVTERDCARDTNSD